MHVILQYEYYFCQRKRRTACIMSTAVICVRPACSPAGICIFRLFSGPILTDMEYGCIDVYKKEKYGQCRVIHSAWSFPRTMDMDIVKAKEAV